MVPPHGGSYGAFSHSRSQRDGVIKYIMTQEEHHMIKTFKEEYLKMLFDFEVEYEEKYLFEAATKLPAILALVEIRLLFIKKTYQ
ncbi:MAG TPA: hypothetical protein VM368_09045 [Flavisolibacter sp.]|nr:hypothetical protein [Flavisolibacter sp.]